MNPAQLDTSGGWFPIHLHCLPAGMTSVQTTGMLLCAEWRKAQLFSVYSTKNKWPTEPGNRLQHFLEQWPRLRPQNWPQCPVFFSVEAESDLGDGRRLPQLRQRGLRCVQPYRDGTQSRYISAFSGLTEDGRILLRTMAQEGILLDLSHLQGPLLRHVLENAPGGRIVSHVVCRDIQTQGVAARANAMTDAELLCCEAKLYGVPFIDDLVALDGYWESEKRDARIELVARHIMHLAALVGVAKVALGPDFQDEHSMRFSRIKVVPEMDQRQGLVRLRTLLIQSGLSWEETNGVFSGNAERVLMSGAD